MPYRPPARFLITPAVFALVLAACADPTPTATVSGDASFARAGDEPGTLRQYGTPIQFGQGRARSYVVLNKGVPLEVGLALDERALDGLRGPMQHGPGGRRRPRARRLRRVQRPDAGAESDAVQVHRARLEPRRTPARGHYTLPHFDFHFYKISVEERDAIVPTDPLFVVKSENAPAPAFIPPFYIAPAMVAIPRMGVHWIDVRSPELQPPPNNKKFTTTFLTGSYDGAVIFQEPMITREFILSKPNVEIPLPLATRVTPAGYYPTAYTITYDEQAKEHRIALSKLTWRN